VKNIKAIIYFITQGWYNINNHKYLRIVVRFSERLNDVLLPHDRFPDQVSVLGVVLGRSGLTFRPCSQPSSCGMILQDLFCLLPFGESVETSYFRARRFLVVSLGSKLYLKLFGFFSSQDFRLCSSYSIFVKLSQCPNFTVTKQAEL
jgi:hypothetical protein